MFRNVGIQESLPRDISTFNSTFVEGLQMPRFLGMLFLIVALILFIIAAFKFKMVVPSIILLGIALGGYYLNRNANNLGAERKEIFLNGEIVYATIKSHASDFNFSLLKNYSIIVDIPQSETDVEIVCYQPKFLEKFPIGKELVGISHNGKYFFGEEMGCHFVLFK